MLLLHYALSSREPATDDLSPGFIVALGGFLAGLTGRRDAYGFSAPPPFMTGGRIPPAGPAASSGPGPSGPTSRPVTVAATTAANFMATVAVDATTPAAFVFAWVKRIAIVGGIAAAIGIAQFVYYYSVSKWERQGLSPLASGALRGAVAGMATAADAMRTGQYTPAGYIGGAAPTMPQNIPVTPEYRG